MRGENSALITGHHSKETLAIRISCEDLCKIGRNLTKQDWEWFVFPVSEVLLLKLGFLHTGWLLQLFFQNGPFAFFDVMWLKFKLHIKQANGNMATDQLCVLKFLK